MLKNSKNGKIKSKIRQLVAKPTEDSKEFSTNKLHLTMNALLGKPYDCSPPGFCTILKQYLTSA
jgi:hypothetical protein